MEIPGQAPRGSFEVVCENSSVLIHDLDYSGSLGSESGTAKAGQVHIVKLGGPADVERSSTRARQPSISAHPIAGDRLDAYRHVQADTRFAPISFCPFPGWPKGRPLHAAANASSSCASSVLINPLRCQFAGHIDRPRRRSPLFSRKMTALPTSLPPPFLLLGGIHKIGWITYRPNKTLVAFPVDASGRPIPLAPISYPD